MLKKHLYLFLFCAFAVTSCVDANGHLNEIGTGLLVGAIGGILIVIWQEVKRIKAIKAKKQAIKDALSERECFTETKVIKGEGENSFYLATDDTRKKVFYVFDDKKVICDYKDVVSVNIEENGAILVSNVETDKALLGALIGDAVGGRRAAFWGAYAFGKAPDQKQITSMIVHVSLRNQSYQSLDFKCFDNGGKALSPGRYRVSYKLATIRAQELYDLFQAIIDEVDTTEKRKKEEEKQVEKEMEKLTAAQELMNVSELYLKGLITDEEFARMKEKIIGKE